MNRALARAGSAGAGCLAAGAAVGGVAPGAGQPGDDRGAAAADDQGEPGGQLADHVRGGDVVAGGVVLAADLPRRLPAQRARRLQRGDVGDAGQEHLHRGGVQDDLAAVLAPPLGELGLAVHDGDDLDALAAGVRQPGRQRDRADLGDLVQAHQQRRVQPPRRRRLARSAPRSSGSPTPWRRTAGRPGRPRRRLRRSCTGCPASRRKAGMSNPVPGAGRTLAARSGSAMNARARDMTIRTVAAVLWASPRSSARV